MKTFYDLNEFSPDQISGLLELARKFEREGSRQELQGKVLALLFLNPSLRTLTSFQSTMVRLGGGTFVISPEMSIHGLETRSGIVMDGTAAEHIREAVPVIASYADAIGIRALAGRQSLEQDLKDDDFKSLGELCDIPVLNLESAIRHPLQSLSDWKTLDDFEIPGNGGKLVFSWVYHPEALPLSVVGDTIHMAAMRGMDVTVIRPDSFALPEPLLQRARSAATVSGAEIIETNNRETGLEGANVIYAGSWSSTLDYGNRVNDARTRNEYEDWCIDESWFANTAGESCRFMHCLPVRRGVEVEDRVLDSSRSIVIPQAKNRMYTQMAVISRMLGE